MTQQELKNRILEKTIPHYMVWESKSVYFDNLYIQKIKELYNLDVVFLYEIDEIVEIYKRNFEKKLYVLRMNSLDPRCIALECPVFNYFIVVVENIGQSNKNSIQGNLVHFIDFDSTNVGSLLKDLYPLTISQAKKVSELCKNDIYKSIIELDKVAMLDGNFVDNLNDLTKKDLMDFNIDFNVFELVGDVINKNKRAIDNMQEFIDTKQNVIGFITALYKTYRNILQIKEQPYYNTEDVEKCTGIKSNMVYAIRKSYNINNFSKEYLIERLKFCSSLINGIVKGIYTEYEAFCYSCLI